MPNVTLREQLFQEQRRLRERQILIVMLLPYMEGKGIPKAVLRDLEKENARLKRLIHAYGYASCCIPHDPPAGAAHGRTRNPAS